MKIKFQLFPKAEKNENGRVVFRWHIIREGTTGEPEFYPKKPVAIKCLNLLIQETRAKNPDAEVESLITDQTGAGERAVYKTNGGMLHEDIPAPAGIGIGPRCKTLVRTDEAKAARKRGLTTRTGWDTLLTRLQAGEIAVDPIKKRIGLTSKAKGTSWKKATATHFVATQLAILENWKGAGTLGRYPGFAGMVPGVPKTQNEDFSTAKALRAAKPKAERKPKAEPKPKVEPKPKAERKVRTPKPKPIVVAPVAAPATGGLTFADLDVSALKKNLTYPDFKGGELRKKYHMNLKEAGAAWTAYKALQAAPAPVATRPAPKVAPPPPKPTVTRPALAAPKPKKAPKPKVAAAAAAPAAPAMSDEEMFTRMMSGVTSQIAADVASSF